MTVFDYQLGRSVWLISWNLQVYHKINVTFISSVYPNFSAEIPALPDQRNTAGEKLIERKRNVTHTGTQPFLREAPKCRAGLLLHKQQHSSCSGRRLLQLRIYFQTDWFWNTWKVTPSHQAHLGFAAHAGTQNTRSKVGGKQTSMSSTYDLR